MKLRTAFLTTVLTSIGFAAVANAQLPDPGVTIVPDATAAAIVAEGDGYQSALVNFRFIVNAVWTTKEAVRRINAGN